MNKDILYWVICLLLTGLFFNLLTGCANMDLAQQNKADAEYRKATQEYVVSQKSKTQDKSFNGPIEMPREWFDQWEQQGETE